jgi:hypothetical protein
MSEPRRLLRPAAIGDAAEIHALLLKIASDIPLAVETLEQEEALYAAVRKTLACGESWVALDDRERIAGVVLVDNVESGRHWGENALLDLRYAAGDALDLLIGKVVQRAVPIGTTVRDSNHSGLAGRLERLGFTQTEARLGVRQFRREPGKA